MNKRLMDDIINYKEEIQQLKEALKDLCEILPNADIWLGDADWKAIETARALIELKQPEK